MDLSAALGRIYEAAEELAEAKASRKPFKIDGIDDMVLVASPVDGTVTPYPLPPPRRAHMVRTIADMVGAIEKLQDGGAKNADGSVTPVRVWVGDAEIRAVLDDTVRRDFIVQRLDKTETFNALAKLSGKPMSQNEMIRSLRTTFRSSTSAAGLLSIVRQIKFKKSDTGFGSVQTGNESMGRSVEAEVTGADDFPDDISIRLQVFRDRSLDSGFEVELVLTLTVDVQEQKFTLELLPDSATNAIDETLSAIVDKMEKEMPGVDVLCGSFKA